MSDMIRLLLTVMVAMNAAADDRLSMTDHIDERSGTPIRTGTFRVLEGLDPAAADAREIHLNVVVLPALAEAPRPDPVFVFAGGPGQHAPSLYGQWVHHWMREERDIVLLGQRGTGGDNDLRCSQLAQGSAQQFLDAGFDEETCRACLAELAGRFDLTQYATHRAIDDAEALREAMGYQQINLYGGSYGTRAELVYLRRHPASIRCAIMNGVAPIEFVNPLYHARGAQNAIERIFGECASDPACRARFGDVDVKFREVLERLAEAPVPTTVTDPDSGEPVDVMLTRAAFAEGLRVLMYWDSRGVPLIIERAFMGDYDTVAQAALTSKRGLIRSLAMGMLLCVTCAEDVARIEPTMVGPATEGTFMGPDRVWSQRAVCEFWPASVLPPDFDEPVESDVPVLLLSGTLDPVTPPIWGDVAGRHLSRSVHVVVPGAHGVGGACVDEIMRAFLDAADPSIVSRDCLAGVSLGPFDLGK